MLPENKMKTPKAKDIHFTIILNKEKKPIFTFEKPEPANIRLYGLMKYLYKSSILKLLLILNDWLTEALIVSALKSAWCDLKSCLPL